MVIWACNVALTKRLIAFTQTAWSLDFQNIPRTSSIVRFKAKKFYMMIISRLCVLRTNSDFCLMLHHHFLFITQAESVYSAVRTGSLYNTDRFRL